MDRERLEKMKLEALRTLASEQGIEGASGLGRAQLIDRLAKSRAEPTFMERAKEAVVNVAHKMEDKVDELEERMEAFADRVEEKAHALADKLRPSPESRPSPPTTPVRRPPGTPSRASFDVPSSTVHPHAEELETLTMARLYLAEGHLDRALEIFEKLLALDPHDELLRAQVEEIRRKRGTVQPLQPPPPPAPGEPLFMLDLEELPDTYGLDECEVLYKDPFWVFAYWEVTDNGFAAARAQLGPSAGSARLVLRLFTTVAGVGGIERQVEDVDLDWNHGRRYLPSPRPGAHLRVAVGLLSQEGYFAPIAHSSLVRVPSPDPGPDGPVEWMEVLPGKSRGREREVLVIVRHGHDHEERGVDLPARSTDLPGSGGTSPRGRWSPGSGSGGVK